MTNHDSVAIDRLDGVPRFEDGMDDVGGLEPRKIGTNGIVENLGEEGWEGVNSMFEEFRLKLLKCWGPCLN